MSCFVALVSQIQTWIIHLALQPIQRECIPLGCTSSMGIFFAMLWVDCIQTWGLILCQRALYRCTYLDSCCGGYTHFHGLRRQQSQDLVIQCNCLVEISRYWHWQGVNLVVQDERHCQHSCLACIVLEGHLQVLLVVLYRSNVHFIPFGRKCLLLNTLVPVDFFNVSQNLFLNKLGFCGVHISSQHYLLVWLQRQTQLLDFVCISRKTISFQESVDHLFWELKTIVLTRSDNGVNATHCSIKTLHWHVNMHSSILVCEVGQIQD